MKKIIVLALTLIACLSGATAQTPDTTIIGTWQGALSISGVRLRVVFHLRDSAGVYLGSIDSPDQNVKDIPIKKTEWKDGKLSLEAPAIAATYAGELDRAAYTIRGSLSQMGKSLQLDLVKNDSVAAVRRPQEPKPPFPYRVEDVTYEGLQNGVKLAGTLTLPEGDGPFPAVVLITGSGPQDRDESLMGHKPFWVLADHLTRRGIAVLRVDDRGIGKSKGDFAAATTEDFATDALAGVKFLKTRPGINPKKIGLIGHSEGGLVAPMAAVQSKDVAFIVMMAGPGVDGAEILAAQGALLMKAQGIPDSSVAKFSVLQKRMLQIAKGGKPDAAAATEIVKVYNEGMGKLTADEKDKFGMHDGEGEAQARGVLSPWFRYFLRFDPRPTLRRVTCPVLAINGEKDLQVPPKQNLPAIESALKAGGNKNFRVAELPSMNHLFQTCATGAIGEYMQIEETISPSALSMMSDWILGLH